MAVQRRRPAAAPLKAPRRTSTRSASPAPSAPAPATRGLDALDRDRAASLADEGGVAGARVEGPRAALATLEEEETMRQATATPRPDWPVPPQGDEPQRPQQRRLPGKNQVMPAFDDSDETPVIPTRLRPAQHDDKS